MTLAEIQEKLGLAVRHAKYEPTPDCGGCNGRGTIERGAKEYPCPCIYFGTNTPFARQFLRPTLKKIIDEQM